MPAQERPKLHAWLTRKQPVWMEGDLRYAKVFDEIATSRHYKTVDCATIGEYGESLGCNAPEVTRRRSGDGEASASCYVSRRARRTSCVRDA